MDWSIEFNTVAQRDEHNFFFEEKNSTYTQKNEKCCIINNLLIQQYGIHDRNENKV